MLDVFTEPETVTCVLCRATVSIRKGDKARFFNHISHDHEVHYDMDLFYVVSFLNNVQINTVIDIINEKIVKHTEEDHEIINSENGKEIESAYEKVDASLQGEGCLEPVEKLLDDDDSDKTSSKEHINQEISDPFKKFKLMDCEVLVPRKAMDINVENKKVKKFKLVSCDFCEKSMRKRS